MGSPCRLLNFSVYTLDTNTIIYYLKDETAVVREIESLLLEPVTLYASAITELELFSHAHLTAADISRIADFLGTLSILPLDSRLARLAGDLRRAYRIPVADSAIAATALFTGSTLLTRNTKDFQRIPGLQVKKI